MIALISGSSGLPAIRWAADPKSNSGVPARSSQGVVPPISVSVPRRVKTSWRKTSSMARDFHTVNVTNASALQPVAVCDAEPATVSALPCSWTADRHHGGAVLAEWQVRCSSWLRGQSP